MSKKCPNCGSYKVDIDCCLNICQKCNKAWKAIPKKKPTVFDHITESVEALADSVVMPIIVEYSGDILWVSPLLQKDASKRAIFFDSKEEAVAATVEELKNEAKDE